MKENQLKISEIKGRFLQFLKIQNISIYKFSKETGIGKSNFSGKSLESELGGQQISEILNYFSGLNPDWLLLGKGEMLRKEDAKQVAMATAPQSNASNGNLNIGVSSELVELIASQQETINRLSQTIDKLINK